MQTPTTQQAKPAKRIKYPYFVATGLVGAFEPGESRPIITVKASCYISYKDEAHSLLVREAKYQLQQAGVPEKRIEALYFEESEITALTACDPKGVRRVYGEPTEAFFDGEDPKKRDVHIRQRRLLPFDHADMLAIYGPKADTAAEQGGAA